MDTYGPLFSDAEDLCRGVIDAALAYLADRLDQVRRMFTDGSWRGTTGQVWALRIERHNGRAVTSTATADVDGKHPGRSGAWLESPSPTN